MRNIAEPLYEVETIINHNMELIHKLADTSKTILADKPEAQAALVEAMTQIWFYLKPVHIWVRDQNPAQKEFYDELDKYLEMAENRSLNVKDLVPKTKRGKK